MVSALDKNEKIVSCLKLMAEDNHSNNFEALNNKKKHFHHDCYNFIIFHFLNNFQRGTVYHTIIL